MPSWAIKKFQYGVCWMVIEFFQSPFDIPPLSDGNWFFFIAKKGGLSKTYDMPPYAIEIF
jgi:hypothetical protein